MSTNAITTNLLIGIVSSVIGALLVLVSQYGIRIRKSSKIASAKRRQDELDQWKINELGIRQGITNYYLFKILRYLFLANMLWLVPEFIEKVFFLSHYLDLSFYRESYFLIDAICRLSSLAIFFLGLGQIALYATKGAG